MGTFRWQEESLRWQSVWKPNLGKKGHCPITTTRLNTDRAIEIRNFIYYTRCMMSTDEPLRPIFNEESTIWGCSDEKLWVTSLQYLWHLHRIGRVERLIMVYKISRGVGFHPQLSIKRKSETVPALTFRVTWLPMNGQTGVTVSLLEYGKEMLHLNGLLRIAAPSCKISCGRKEFIHFTT